MLGYIGFFVAAFSVLLFAVTFNRAFPLPQKRYNDMLSFACYLLAGALILWSVTVNVRTPEFTEQAILIGEVLLGIASIAMLNIIRPLGSAGNALAVMVLGFALVYRHTFVDVTAFVQDGLLHFNLQGGVRDIILGMVLLVWLPALLVLVAKVAHTFPAVQPVRSLLSTNFAFLAFLTALFLAARRPAMIIAFFIGIVAVFLLASACNVLIGRTLVVAGPAAVAVKGKKKRGTK